jgi:3-deoxy-7-phosphoheptulonate synthase
MKKGHTQAQLKEAISLIETMGFTANIIPGSLTTAIGITGNPGRLDPRPFSLLEGVAEAMPVSKPFKLPSRDFKPENTVVSLADGKVEIGRPDRLCVMAGPCAVESEEQLLRIAGHVKAAGGHMLRGGAFKPRSSTYAFQGMGEDGLKILAAARAEYGLPVITEALDTRSLELVATYADMIQIGARNMQNYTLLREAGRMKVPVMLKRGMSATLEEWLQAAEYIMAEGNRDVVLCERGIRTFATHTRNTLDLNVVPVLKAACHLPIIVDPSHGTGIRSKVPAMARAAAAIPPHGLMIEVHDQPEKAMSDGPQSLLPGQFSDLMRQLEALGQALGYRVLTHEHATTA